MRGALIQREARRRRPFGLLGRGRLRPAVKPADRPPRWRAAGIGTQGAGAAHGAGSARGTGVAPGTGAVLGAGAVHSAGAAPDAGAARDAGGSTLEELVNDVWERVSQGELASCPCCGGEMVPTGAAPPHLAMVPPGGACRAGGACRDCGARLE